MYYCNIGSNYIVPIEGHNRSFNRQSALTPSGPKKDQPLTTCKGKGNKDIKRFRGWSFLISEGVCTVPIYNPTILEPVEIFQKTFFDQDMFSPKIILFQIDFVLKRSNPYENN